MPSEASDRMVATWRARWDASITGRARARARPARLASARRGRRLPSSGEEGPPDFCTYRCVIP